ncbi:hypothetical protein E4U17_000743 [Claviceps sp. LM77 group G4]|nr:hypothetical protein E4U17_000743 [Claviceps sp. LM77 group G4]KAG6054635.1 hypothetical protein E4U33_008066 [Claviceps sp. LM78 group G4]KAG6074135.1 hypothetical protein E4U16_004203 [Claviceps sp. LM84 group G4]
MKLSAATILSMAAVPALAGDVRGNSGYILSCSRSMYKGGNAQSYFNDFYKKTCQNADCGGSSAPAVGTEIVSGSCLECPIDLDINSVPNCELLPIS